VGKTEEEAFERMRTAVLWHVQAGERRSAWAEVRDLEVTELLG
jgi:hypothetical protein